MFCPLKFHGTTVRGTLHYLCRSATERYVSFPSTRQDIMDGGTAAEALLLALGAGVTKTNIAVSIYSLSLSKANTML